MKKIRDRTLSVLPAVTPTLGLPSYQRLSKFGTELASGMPPILEYLRCWKTALLADLKLMKGEMPAMAIRRLLSRDA